jgi:hypothetical protein
LLKLSFQAAQNSPNLEQHVGTATRTLPNSVQM